jgi:hypothetical protein
MFDFHPGDIFFCRGKGAFDQIILFFESLHSQDGDTRSSHCGVIIGADGTNFETTPWKTQYRNMNTSYAGSDIAIFRWAGMDAQKALRGQMAVSGQMGRFYPYWRLLSQATGLAGVLHGKGMECCILVAHFIEAAGFPLGVKNIWTIQTEWLYDHLRRHPEWTNIFDGVSLRTKGFIP